MSDNLYIVDNMSPNKTVKHYLTEWCSISKQMDIATGYFEIGGLLELGNNWQAMDKIRIILWETTIKKYIPEVLGGFSKFVIINHTDLLLEKNQDLMNSIAQDGEIVIICIV